MSLSRLDEVRQVVDEILRQQPNEDTRRWGLVHLYGVSATCALLALRRGLDPELCAVAGMLHDVWSYMSTDQTDHARLSSLETERILTASSRFTPEEVAVVCGAIAGHSDKAGCDGVVDELLKDADVLQHVLYNPVRLSDRLEQGEVTDAAAQAWMRRWQKVSGELGLDYGH